MTASCQVAAQEHKPFHEKTLKSLIWRAVKHRHSLASWYLIYSESLPRSVRALKLGVEVLLFMLTVAFQTQLVTADPGCSDEISVEGCLKYEAAIWVGGGDMCEWDICAQEVCFYS